MKNFYQILEFFDWNWGPLFSNISRRNVSNSNDSYYPSPPSLPRSLSSLLHIDNRVNIARDVERKSDEGEGISGIACTEERGLRLGEDESCRTKGRIL